MNVSGGKYQLYEIFVESSYFDKCLKFQFSIRKDWADKFSGWHMKLHILVNFPNGSTVCQPVSIILVFRNVILSKSWMFILNKTLSFNFLNFLSFFKFTLFDLPGRNPLQTLTRSIPDFFQSFQKVEFFICNYYKSPLTGILVNCLDRISAYP